MGNSLVYGKNNLDRIVSVEPGQGSTCEIFRELEDGTIESRNVPMSHYLLFAEQKSPKFKELAGNQHYKYLYETDSRAKYEEVLAGCYKNRYDFHVIRDAKEAFMVKDGYTYFKGMKVEDVSVMSVDLEHSFGVGSEPDPNGELFIIVTTFRKKGVITKKMFSLDEYQDEAKMLEDFCLYVCEKDPSIVIGHNKLGHDLPILKFAASRAGIQLKMGRNGSSVKFATKASQFRKDGSQTYDYFNAWIYGREIVDTYFLAIKYDIARNYESYGLKAIIKHEGIEREGRVHYDASKIKQDWQDPEKRKQIKEYAIDDADDALKLFDLMIPSLFYYTQTIPRSFQQVINTASGSQLNSMMIRAYLQQGHSIAKGSEAVEYQGAISLAVPGIHKNVLRLDCVSMYPSIMKQYEIYNKHKDPQAIFLKLVEYFLSEKLRYGKLGVETGDGYYTNNERAFKILANSLYGFLGAPKLNYNFPEGAARVTEYGRNILKKAIKLVTGRDNILEEAA